MSFVSLSLTSAVPTAARTESNANRRAPIAHNGGSGSVVDDLHSDVMIDAAHIWTVFYFYRELRIVLDISSLLNCPMAAGRGAHKALALITDRVR